MTPIRHNLPQPAPRSGASLTEVLMAIMIMGIGVVSVTSLFPASVVRTVEATKLTNATILKDHATDLILGNPKKVNGVGPVLPWRPFTPDFLNGIPQWEPAYFFDTKNNIPGPFGYRVNDVVVPRPTAGGRITPMHRYLNPATGLYSHYAFFAAAQTFGNGQSGYVRDGSQYTADIDAPPDGILDTDVPAWPPSRLQIPDPLVADAFLRTTAGATLNGVNWFPIPLELVTRRDVNIQGIPLDYFAYIVDPNGWAHYAQETNNPGHVLANEFGHVVDTSTLIAPRPFLQVPTDVLPRLSAGLAFSLPQAWTVADLQRAKTIGSIVTSSLDSWADFFPQPIGVASFTPTSVTINPPDVQNLAPLFINPPIISARAILLGRDGRTTEIRQFLGPGAGIGEITWADGTVNALGGPQPLSLRMQQVGVESIRVQQFEPRYSWLLTVRKGFDGKAEVDMVVFFNRNFDHLSEQLHVMREVDSNGLPITDVNGNVLGIRPGAERVEVAWDIPAEKPEYRRGGYLFDYDNAMWYRISKVTDKLSSVILDLESPMKRSSLRPYFQPGRAMLLQNVAEVFRLGVIE